MDNKITGIIMIVSMLAGFGGSQLLTQDELSNAYVCTITEEIGIFNGGISGTGLTGYPYSENRTDAVKCVGGKWIKLETYAKSKGVDPLTLLIKEKIIEEVPPISLSGGIQYSCNQFNCTKIK